MANTSCAGAAKALGPFDFRRLGLRSTAMIISPWIAKGSVIQAPQGPYATSQWEHSSIPATAKTLFNLTGFLTQRVRPKAAHGVSLLMTGCTGRMGRDV